MQLEDYQKRAMTTCTKSSENFSYMMLNLVGEVGEFASKVAKAIRKEQIKMLRTGDIHYNIGMDAQEMKDHNIELKKEVGDILWQLSGLCTVMGWSLDEIAQENLRKLADRQSRNVIVGEGDNR